MIGPRRGRFRPPDRRLVVSLQGREPVASVETDGRLRRQWRRRSRRIEVPLQDDGTAHRVQLHRA